MFSLGLEVSEHAAFLIVVPRPKAGGEEEDEEGDEEVEEAE